MQTSSSLPGYAHLLLLLASPITSASSPATDLPLCDDPQSRQFDFWIGDWQVRQQILRSNGTWITLPATTSVRRSLSGCAIEEHWKGLVQFFWEGMERPEHMVAQSIRTFDPVSSRWSIWWIDSRTRAFDPPYTGTFTGTFGNGSDHGIFIRTQTVPTGEMREDRITFDHPTDDRVHWALSTSTDGGRSRTTIWTMTMCRIEGDSQRAPKEGDGSGIAYTRGTEEDCRLTQEVPE